MENCPYCGARLFHRLVKWIDDPFSPESCPKKPRSEKKKEKK